MRALVVDDSRAVRRMIDRILSGLGFRTVEAADGREALAVLAAETAEHGPPDVVLVDWNMPTMDGIAFLKAVRRERRFADLKVVMVTSESGPEQILRALAAGADEYAMKPFTRDVIEEKLRLLGVVA